LSETKLKRYLKILYKNLNVLQEREAKYGGNAPVDLLNEIEDHQTAIALVVSRLAGDISDEQLSEQLAPLNVSHGRANTIPIPTLPLALVAVSVLGLLGFISYRLITPTPTPTALPTSTPTPIPTPSRMSGDFNIAVAEIGQQDANGALKSSKDGQQLGQWIFTELQNEYQNLPQEFDVQVWHDGPELAAKNVTIGLVADDAAAAKLANEINANLVIYGNLVGPENAANFTPKFYIKPLQGEAGELDELKGPFQLGAPIPIPIPLDTGDPVLIASLKPEVSLRAKTLRWFTIGLIWDLAGQTVKALTTFQQAEQELKEWGEKNQGKEILYYFIGREALFLSRSEAEAQKVFASAEEARATAEAYFQKALSSNSNYARAYIGLGSVYFQRAQRQSPEDRLAGPDLDQAISYYEQAIANAPTLPGDQVEHEARFGLAVAYQLKGDAYFQLGVYDEANTYFDWTIREMQTLVAPLTAAKQQRSLGHIYLALGVAYNQQAIIHQKQGDKAGSISLYQKAQEAYTNCIAQRNPADKLLKNIIETYCQPYHDKADKARQALEGE
jgi:tetratricopeptide (TPR) repeat protein